MESENKPAGAAQADDKVAPLLKRSLHKIIDEDDFLVPLKENSIYLFRLFSSVSFDYGNVSARFYFNLKNEAQRLETFLDNYGARLNNRYHYFTELIASMRNFAIAAFHLSHVLNRYADYHPEESEQASQAFIEKGLEAGDQINNIEKGFMQEAMEELKRQGCELTEDDIKPAAFKDIDKHEKLPSNLMSEEFKTSEQRIMRIAETYRKVAIKVNRDRFDKMLDPEEFEKIIPSRVNETKVKILENTLHTLQSEYDTHVRMTDVERGDPELFNLRAYISIPMHLFEMARWLIHFYERHENEMKPGDSANRIAEIADKKIILKLISHFCFHHAHRHMMSGKKLAEKVMSKRIRKNRVKLQIPQPAGFHARPAYYVTLVVEEHGTDVFMMVDKRKFDARSVLDLLEGGGMVADLRLEEIEFEGDDRTLADLKILADCNYCEDEKIPKGLNYIRVARNIMP